MIAGETLSRQLPYWLAERHARLTHLLAPVPALALALWLSLSGLSEMLWMALIGYASVQLWLLWMVHSHPASSAAQAPDAEWPSILADALLGIVVIGAATSLVHFLPIYVLIAWRALSGYRRNQATAAILLVLGPIFLFQLLLNRAGNAALTADEQWGVAAILASSLGCGIVAIMASARQKATINQLKFELQRERNTREARVEELEHLANELRMRMRERHALEEGLRAITSTLSLDDVLEQILDSTVQTFGAERTHAVVLTLQTDGSLDNRMFARDQQIQAEWVEPLIRRVMRDQTPAVVADSALDPELGEISKSGLRSIICVPLFVGDGPPRGALTVVSATFAAFSSSDARHLSAFAAQAGIAIGNAELHSRLRRQQHLLQAVLRDINDGLVVLDKENNVVLANPIGQALLNDTSAPQPWLERMRELASRLSDDGRPVASPEWIVGDPECEEGCVVYQAVASRVRTDDNLPDLTAIVLHDITDHKAEERARMDFISMVSHELRNPLHTLNGFVKLVLQGRAGPLTPLQQDFLSMADEQIEQLSGRVSELLEYNRFKAGRLALQPEVGDLSLLIAGTVNRLKLQAEQHQLSLINETPNLPLCRFDSQRIGQVLTNLIENAIKATPAGGTIRISAEVYDQEVRVRVADTGVGIPASELGKIFQRFYQVAKHRRAQGTNMGLGLAICQQIVEGHGGRIWVESEEGVGTTFTFTLPLAVEDVHVTG
ncbi:MAG: ATP-binding protein [Roseiflexus sp.]|nr:ATP-binding protein [Roseiflexus sp.]MCS7287511.1 ATP-binding protein [Roseiflexus sp.]MDW8146194.1 ATP-binding protein [Roseiflexaceae bacterium]MDW8231367.1 ATP-binding protein [Roseiflexaceae bacterium]